VGYATGGTLPGCNPVQPTRRNVKADLCSRWCRCWSANHGRSSALYHASVTPRWVPDDGHEVSTLVTILLSRFQECTITHMTYMMFLEKCKLECQISFSASIFVVRSSVNLLSFHLHRSSIRLSVFVVNQ